VSLPPPLTLPVRRITLPVRSIAHKRCTSRSAQKNKSNNEPCPSRAADSRTCIQGSTDTSRDLESKREHSYRADEIGSELDVDQDTPLWDREEEGNADGEPEDEETDHIGAVEGRVGRHFVRKRRDRREDRMKDDVDTLTACNAVDTIPDTSRQCTIEDGPEGAVYSER
jgi:hypothetical protein